MHCDSTPANYFAAALAPPKPQVGNCENRNMISPYPKPSATHSIMQWFGKIFDALCILELVSADILALPSATLPTFFLRTLNLLCTASALLFWIFNLKRFRLWGTRDQIKWNLLKVLEIILILDCKMSPRPSNKSKQIIEGKCSHSPVASINSWGGGVHSFYLLLGANMVQVCTSTFSIFVKRWHSSIMSLWGEWGVMNHLKRPRTFHTPCAWTCRVGIHFIPILPSPHVPTTKEMPLIHLVQIHEYIFIYCKEVKETDCHGTFCKRKKWNPATLVPDLPYQIFLLCALRRYGLQLIHRSNDLTYKATIRFSAETLPFHIWFTVTVLHLLYIEHGSTALFSEFPNFVQMYSILILSNFTFSYFPCSELWTPLSSGTGIWRSYTSSSKGWCACTCNLAVLPAQLQRETSGFSLSLSLSLVRHAHRCGKNWHWTNWTFKLKLISPCAQEHVLSNLFCDSLIFPFVCTGSVCWPSKSNRTISTLPAASDLGPDIQPKILRCRERMPQFVGMANPTG